MTNLINVSTYFQTVWSDFIVKDQTSFDTMLTVRTISATDTLIDVELGFNSWNAYNLKGYGKGNVTTSVTEQQAFDAWQDDFQKKQTQFNQKLRRSEIFLLPQCVYDGLLFHSYVTNNFLEVYATEGIYDLLLPIRNKDWDTLASMIMRSTIEKQKCVRAATILRLADYGKTKNRKRLRTEGLYNIRSRAELGAIVGEELKRARFAYYAETLKFLPNIPDSTKRDIAKEYNSTILSKQYIYSNSTNFTLVSSPSMDPVEKLLVKVNGDIIQHFYDYTIDGNVLTITKSLNQNDIIDTSITI